MIEIKVPNSSYSRQEVTLESEPYSFYFKYNVRNESWYLSIKDYTDSYTILDGIKVMPNQNLTGRYIDIDLPKGMLVCLRMKNTNNPISRDNLGKGKEYGIFWYDSDEVQEFSLDDRSVQL